MISHHFLGLLVDRTSRKHHRVNFSTRRVHPWDMKFRKMDWSALTKEKVPKPHRRIVATLDHQTHTLQTQAFQA